MSSGDRYPSKRKSNGTTKTKSFRSGVGAVTSLGVRVGLNLGGTRPVSAPTITVNNNGFYFSMKTPDGTDVETLEEFSGLSNAEIQASVILHELAHAFNAIPADGKNSKQSRANSKKIKQMCFSPLARLFRDRNQPVNTEPGSIGTEVFPMPIQPLPIFGGGWSYSEWFFAWAASWKYYHTDVFIEETDVIVHDE